MKRTLPFLCFALLFLTLSDDALAQTCRSNALATEFRGNLNQDLNDYGLFFLDVVYNDYGTTAGRDCIRQAAQKLYSKLKATNDTTSHADNSSVGKIVGPHKGWLEGGGLYFSFATAMRLADLGELNADFDRELIRARNFYYETLSTSNPYGLDTGGDNPSTPQVESIPGCGHRNPYPSNSWTGNGNTCMDDHAVGASAFAWIAAYEKERGRDASSYITAAVNALNRTFSTYESICINNPSQAMSVSAGGPCNGTITQLSNLQAGTRSINHGIVNIPYGLGLMTSLSTAVIGLEEAGYITSPSTFFSGDQKTIAKALLREGQEKAAFNGASFDHNCPSYVISGSNVVVNSNQACSAAGYVPKMYPLKKFYARYNLGTPDNAVVDPEDPYPVSAYTYGYDSGSPSLFSDDYTQFFGAGRRATYIDISYFWQFLPGDTLEPNVTPRPALTGAARTHGYVDGISSAGVISGWACDQYNTANAVGIHIYAGSTYVTATTANLGSEPAVNTQCRGGSAHRFQAQLPSWTKGQTITTYALDGTWKGHALVPSYSCSNAPYCFW